VQPNLKPLVNNSKLYEDFVIEINNRIEKAHKVLEHTQNLEKGYNKGGVVKMQEGGMKDSGVDIDPVSGNEVPPGSLPEEVRDTVDAKLSVGEYVVPADVLQYYGMKFFEDLRKKAKEDLSQMEQNGRIGGEPVEEEVDLTPEEMQMLQEVMGQGTPQQFNQGGVVGYNPQNWQNVGSSYFGNMGTATGGGGVYKTYVGPNGETRMIYFLNGQPTTPIPEGFKEKTDPTNQQAEKQEQEQQQASKTDDTWNGNTDSDWAKSPQGRAESKGWGERNQEALRKDPVAFGLSALESLPGEGLVGGLVSTVLGNVPGGIVGAGRDIHQLGSARAALMVAKENNSPEEEIQKLEDRIAEFESGLDPIAKMMVSTGAGSGRNFYEDWQEFSAKRTFTPSESSGPSPSKSFSGNKKKLATNQPKFNQGRDPYADGNQDRAMAVGRDLSGFDAAEQDARNRQGTNSPGSTTGQPMDEDDLDDIMGGFKKGGLVSRPKKTAKTSRTKKKSLVTKK